jgi:N-acetylglucosamine-6-sulfatase
MRTTWPRRAAALAGCALATAVLAGGAEASARPNIVFIYADDMNAAEFKPRYMPRTTRLIANRGTTFSNYVVASPICCPSRAAMLTGSYPHNNGVLMNNRGYSRLRAPASNLGSWLQRAGYRTAWIGKFLQGYGGAVANPSRPAPGFDDWAISLRAKYFNWKLFTDGRDVVRARSRSDYYTDALTRRATRILRSRLRSRRPVFMVVNHLAPHRGKGGRGRCSSAAAPARRDFGRFGGEALPPKPSLAERDRSDKTLFPAGRDLGAPAIRRLRDRFRCRIESLAAMDRGIARVGRAVARAGELGRTVFVFTSDNGVLLGEHGLDGKGIPYEEGIRMPLAIRAPQRFVGGRLAETDALAANIDLAPTLLQLAGAGPCVHGRCRTLDGRSLVPLLRGREGDWPRNRAILIEGGAGGDVCGYRGVRLETEVLLHDVAPTAGACRLSGRPEYYDLARDPFQLDNLVATEPLASTARVGALRTRLERLMSCAGRSGPRACE